ncbi:MAG: SDR family NAD(P)-dependent oxidoreductase [Thermanaerothrix sp.]|nr:SDR family NAD(P)-dependent oxidoreductase [Thermanaerothrix sp.]
MPLLKGGLALITGATSGIGLAYARRLGSMGYGLIMTGRRMDLLRQRAHEIERQFRVPVEPLMAELSKEEDIEALEAVIGERRPNFLLNNAGFGLREAFADTPRDLWEALIWVHVMAPLRLTQAALKVMGEEREGVVVNVSSEAAFIPVRRNSVYAGAKAFLLRWTESVALEMMDSGVRLQALCPGMTRSDFHPRMGAEGASLSKSRLIPWMTPEEVVEESIRDLERGKVVCVPKLAGKARTLGIPLIPQRMRLRCLNWFFRTSSGADSCNKEN